MKDMGSLQLLLLSIIVSLVFGFVSGWKVNTWKHSNEREIEQRIFNTTMELTAKEIAKIEVKNVTIKQQLDTVVREVPVYSECKHSDDGMLLINKALSGSSTSSDSKLPGTNSTK